MPRSFFNRAFIAYAGGKFYNSSNMKKTKIEGFALIETALLTVIAVVIIATGFYVIRSRNNANKSYNSSVDSSLPSKKTKQKNNQTKQTAVQQNNSTSTSAGNQAPTSNAATNPGLGSFDSGMTLIGTVSGKTASVHWQWGKNEDPSNGFNIYYAKGGPNYTGAPSFSQLANSYQATLNMPDAGTYYLSICPAAKPAKDSSCSNSLVLTAKLY
jgi:Flp pilus assembly pilin Flp